ncbi:MAG TPA: flavodoxin domain-containing protein [Micromonosporaceae bacterium]
MRAVVAYESLFGNTRQVAEAIGDGLRTGCQVDVVPTDKVSPEAAREADLLVVGGPTQAFRASSRKTRESAIRSEKPEATANATSAEFGARELIGSLPPGEGRRRAATFDTRMDKPRIITGAASKSLGRLLERAGYRLVVPPESFLVGEYRGPLVAGELARARDWGARLASLAVPTA